MRLLKLNEENLKKTRERYKEFCERSDVYDDAKDYIDSISPADIERYREIILAEHEASMESEKLGMDIFVSVLLSSIISSIISSSEIVDAKLVVAVAAVIATLILVIYRHYVCDTKKRQRYINTCIMIEYLKSKK